MPGWRETGNRIVLVNDDGEWSLWRTFEQLAPGRHVGPGYIGEYKHTSSRVLVDDTVHGIRTLNDPVSGGFGAFGVAVAQRTEWFPQQPFNYTWDITERMDGRPPSTGAALHAARSVQPPRHPTAEPRPDDASESERQDAADRPGRVMFHGWEGGSGYPDCRCTYRAAVPGDVYEVRTRYSLGDGWA